MQGSGYDGSGNQKVIGGSHFVWDAESRMVLSDIGGGATQYSYDGDGRRVVEQGPLGTTTYVYDAMGDLTAE